MFFKNKICQPAAISNATNETSSYDVLSKLYENKEKLELEINNSLYQERRSNSDLILVDVVDTYRNLTLKVLKGFTAAIRARPTIKYILKIDDDNYYKIDKYYKLLEEVVEESKSSSGSDPIESRGSTRGLTPLYYIGAMKHNTTVIRPETTNTKHNPKFELKKWSENEYENDIYPTFANGMNGYGLSGKLVEMLVDYHENSNNSTNNLPLYHNEDTSIGIWLDILKSENIKNGVNQPIKYLDLSKNKKFGSFTDTCDLNFCINPNIVRLGHHCSAEIYQACRKLVDFVERKGFKNIDEIDLDDEGVALSLSEIVAGTIKDKWNRKF